MKARWWFILVILCLAVILALRTKTTHPQPLYQGHTANYWICMAHLPIPQTNSPVAQAAASQKFISRAAALNFENDSALSLAPQSHPFSLPSNPPYNLTQRPQIMSLLHPDAFPILLPELLRALKGADQTNAANAAMILAQIGLPDPEVIQALTDAVQAHESLLQQAYRNFWSLLPATLQAQLTKPGVLQNFANRYADPWFARAAAASIAFDKLALLARAWETKDPSSSPTKPFLAAIPHLITGARDKDDKLCLFSARCLGHIGPPARAAIPVLIQALQDTNRPDLVREAVAISLAKIQPESPEVIQALITTAGGNDRSLAAAAIFGLSQGGPASKAALPVLRDLWHGHDSALHYLAYEALCQISPEEMRDAIPPMKILPPGMAVTAGGTRYRVGYFTPYPAAASSDYELITKYQHGGMVERNW